MQRKYVLSDPDIVYEPDYDNLSRITEAYTYKDTPTPTEVVKFTYEYQTNTNNISKQTYEHRSGDPDTDFTYDNLDRLTEADYGIDSTDEVFTIDDLGNRDTVNLRSGSDEDYDIDELTNRYEEIDSASLEYDNAGNLARDKDGYEYDYENRIVKITKDSNDIAEYAYDALGRRIKKVDYYPTPDETTLYYHNYN
ncbi:hypothetical protein ACFL1G_11755 [Planctomycetota bacterium]